MTTLDVALRLRLVNQLSAGAKAVARDLTGVKTAARGIEGRGAGKLKRDILDVSTASRRAGRGLNEVRRESSQLGRDRGAQRLRRDLLGVSSAARQAERSLEGTRRAASGLGKERGAGLSRDTQVRGAGFKSDKGGRADAILTGGRSLGALGGGYLGYRTASGTIRSIVDQDNAWAEVRKKVNGTPEQLAALQTELRAMAVKFGMSIPEAFAQAAEAGAAGIDVKEITEAVRTAMMGSVAWDTNARETMNYMMRVRAAMNWTHAQTKEWADKVNAIADASEVAERELIEASKRSFAPGKAAGVDPDTVMAVTGGQMAGGMPEEVAARWFNTFSARLAGAKAGTKKQREALKKYLGIEPKALAAGMEKDARTTMLAFLRKFEALPQQQKIEFGVKFFGQEWWDETVRATNVLEKIGQMLDLLNDKSKWSGSMERNLAIKLETIAAQYERMAAAAASAAAATDRMSGTSQGFKTWADVLAGLLEKYTAFSRGVAERNDEIARQKQRQRTATEERRRRSAVEAKNAEVAMAERDLAAAETTARLRPGLGRDPGDARRKVERLRAEAEAMRRFKPPPRAAGPFTPLPLADVPSVGKKVEQALDAPQAAAIGKQVMERYGAGLALQGESAIAVGREIVDRLKALFSFTLTPTISPRLAPPAAAAPLPQSAPGKQSSRAGATVTNNFYVNGAGDPAAVGRAVARQVAALADNSGVLFDRV